MRSLRLSLLGGFQAHDAEGRRIPISGNKVILLLAYLALRAGEPQTREKLMALLWGERGESQARGSLRQALWTLRRALKGLEPSALIVDKEVLALDPLAAEIDTLTFASLIEEGSPEALQAAIGLYRGQLLEGVRARDRSIEDVLADERRRLHELAIEADVKLLEHWSGEGADEKATAAAKHLLTLDPMDETAHRALMRNYADKGQLSLARAQYDTCRTVLRRELEVDPQPETERLFEQINLAHSDPTASTLDPIQDHCEEKPSIAVLPFANLSGDPEQEYFSDGITEDIITALSRLRWFLVISRNSSFVYKTGTVGIKQIGRELGVRYLLEGSVRKAGERLRITAQLVDAASGAQHWAEHYDRQLRDIFALQDDITQSVTAAIEPKLVAAEVVRSQRRSSENLGAWDLVMRALRHYWRMTTKDSEAAIAMLRQAVRQYPDYGPAHSLLAFALLVSGHVGWVPESGESRYRSDLTHRYAADLARRAVALDDEDPWAHLALGYLSFTERDTEATVREYKRALDLNPNFATAYGYLGWALVFDGQSVEAIRYFQQALRMSPHDPLKAFFYSGTCVAHYFADRYEEAITWGRKALSERPGFTAAHRILCASLAQAGKKEETAEAMARLREVQPNVSVEWIERYVPYTPRAMPHFLAGMRKAGLE
jgi:TolB-like protein/two-component SAPR family response regulator